MDGEMKIRSVTEIVNEAGGPDEFLRKARAMQDALIIGCDKTFGYTVRCGDRYQDKLGPDEALWLVVRFLTGSKPDGLRTQEQHDDFHRRYGPKPPLEPWQKQIAPVGTENIEPLAEPILKGKKVIVVETPEAKP